MSVTPKIKLKLFEESDYVDFEDINDNSRKIDTAFTWSQLNNTWYSGAQSQAIPLPENFSELSIKVNIGGQNIICKLFACSEELYDNHQTQSFRTGYYLNSDNGGCADFAICKESINLSHAWLNGESTETTAATTWTVYTK